VQDWKSVGDDDGPVSDGAQVQEDEDDTVPEVSFRPHAFSSGAKNGFDGFFDMSTVAGLNMPFARPTSCLVGAERGAQRGLVDQRVVGGPHSRRRRRR
jgi:hypothetical protein